MSLSINVLGMVRSVGSGRGSQIGYHENSPSVCSHGKLKSGTRPDVQLLQGACSKLSKKYQRQKTKQLRGFDDLFDEESRRVEAYSTVSDSLVESLKKEIIHLSEQLQETGIQEIISRSMVLEEDYIECQNDLVMEGSRSNFLQFGTQTRAKGSSFIYHGVGSQVVTQKIRIVTRIPTVHPASDGLESIREARLTSTTRKHSIEAIHAMPQEETGTVFLQSNAEALADRGKADESKLLLELMENLIQLTAVVDGISPHKIIFTHNETVGNCI